jgi:hypothetical protein
VASSGEVYLNSFHTSKAWVEYQAVPSVSDVAHVGWLCTYTFTILQQLEIPSACSWAASVYLSSFLSTFFFFQCSISPSWSTSPSPFLFNCPPLPIPNIILYFSATSTFLYSYQPCTPPPPVHLSSTFLSTFLSSFPSTSLFTFLYTCSVVIYSQKQRRNSHKRALGGRPIK